MNVMTAGDGLGYNGRYYFIISEVIRQDFKKELE